MRKLNRHDLYRLVAYLGIVAVAILAVAQVHNTLVIHQLQRDIQVHIIHDRAMPPLPGPRGPVGLPGPQGKPGVRGLAGLPGATGRNGRSGKAGAQGMTGPRGLRGPEGDRGPIGVPGPTGQAGIVQVVQQTVKPLVLPLCDNNVLKPLLIALCNS